MSPPIGKQIRAILEASDRIGKPAQASVLMNEAGIVATSTGATRLCRRAEQYGLADSIEGVPLRFMARRGWRDMIDGGPARNKGIKPMPARVMPTKVINSVFSLAL